MVVEAVPELSPGTKLSLFKLITVITRKESVIVPLSYSSSLNYLDPEVDKNIVLNCRIRLW